jgi:tRNA(Ile)-lysidine synthase
MAFHSGWDDEPIESRSFVKFTSPVIDEVHRFLQAEGIAPAAMVVAVSGGPDSVALLLALLRLAHQPATSQSSILQDPLVIAHLNHKLRAAQSDADERFVRDLHAALSSKYAGRPDLQCESIDVAAYARQARGNLEGVARRLRYEWLGKSAADAGIRFVATGHTLDDQAETVLFRLLRGTGVKGLSGIGPRRPLISGIELIRPLLRVRREEVLEFLFAEEQDYCNDETNLDLRYTRNRIRHELIPQLAQTYNPAIVAVLGRLAEQAREIFRLRQSHARQLLSEIEHPRAGSLVILDRERLTKLPRHLIREIFHDLWAREGWSTSRMGFREWDRLADFAMTDITAMDFPDGVRIQCRERVVQIGRGS